MKRNDRSRCPALVVASLCVLLGLPPAEVASAQTSRHQLKGKEVAIYNLIGQASVVSGSGPQVEVEVTFGGEDAGRLKVETGTVRGKETLRVIYPGDRFVYKRLHSGSSIQMGVNDDGTFGGGFSINGGGVLGKLLGQGRSVRISGRGSGLEAFADMTIRMPKGVSLAVYQGVGDLKASNVEGDLRLDTSSSPVSARGVRGNLFVDVGSGSVEVSDVDGSLDVDTGSGEVSIARIRVDHLIVDTGSGEVIGTDIKAKRVSVDTGSGEIEMEDLEATDVDLDTGSGSIGLDLRSDVESISIDTGSGDVRIAVPSELGAEIEIETGSGDIEIDVPHESSRHRDSYFSGKVGDGLGMISVETGSGGVRLVSRKL